MLKTAENWTLVLDELAGIIRARLRQFFSENGVIAAAPPGSASIAASLNRQSGLPKPLTIEESLVVMLALAPHLQPDFFDNIIRENIPQAGDFPKLGFVKGKQFRGFLPTGETALFLLAGDDLHERFRAQQLFSADHFFAKKRLLWLDEVPEGEPRMSGRIILSHEYVDLFTSGKIERPHFSMTFPAERIETLLDWSDLVLNSQTMQQIRELEIWVKHGDTLMNDWGMGKRLRPGYRALFYGPPGTGKTLTATLLGKYTKRDVYRVDLSMVISKFIGETEKNLANLFAKAENKDWILFFDEADALFGKRTNVRDAHDKYANQEVSYLLQRVENYNGLVILASNQKSNIDDAFMRRFQSLIHFPAPNASERVRLWKNAFPLKANLDPRIDLSDFARKYDLTGADIMNVVQFSCLCALHRGNGSLLPDDILEGIRREYRKEGKIMPE
jgi:Cdc6-like AAA superfamily ATPase